MGAVAAAFRELGFIVTGSDENIYPPMSTFLEAKEIKISSGFRPENIPAEVDLVVIGNALCRGNPELEAVLEADEIVGVGPEVFLAKLHDRVRPATGARIGEARGDRKSVV